MSIIMHEITHVTHDWGGQTLVLITSSHNIHHLSYNLLFFVQQMCQRHSLTINPYQTLHHTYSQCVKPSGTTIDSLSLGKIN